MRRIALVNQKGGVGKTTTAVNLSAGLARLGHKVLLIDFDPQSNATIAFGYPPGELEHSVYDLILGDMKFEEVILHHTEHLDILPSNIDLAGAEVELAHQIGRETILADRLKGQTHYDFVLVDCPPSLGLLNINALTYVDEIFIPMECEFFALQGISLLNRTIELVRNRLNPELSITGVIPCMYDRRTSLAKEVVSEIETHFGDRVFKTRIRPNVRLAEAPSFGQTIFDYAPESNGAIDYTNLSREVAGLPLEEESGDEESTPGSLRQAFPGVRESEAGEPAAEQDESANTAAEIVEAPAEPTKEGIEEPEVPEETQAEPQIEPEDKPDFPVNPAMAWKPLPAPIRPVSVVRLATQPIAS